MFSQPLKTNLSAVLAVVLATLPVGRPPLAAQDQPAPSKLNLVIVEGDGAINNLRQRVAREPVVQVEDENHRPIAGAAVVFSLPSQGAGGTFANGARSLTVMTDDSGRAVARGIQLNKSTGQMQIRVTASFRGQTASAVITQTVAAGGAAGAGGGMSAGKIALIVAVVGGAAAAGIAVGVTRGGGSSPASIITPTPSTVLSPGTPAVGPPH